MLVISIGSDHAGFALKERLIEAFSEKFKFEDVAPHYVVSSDYPDIAKRVVSDILGKDADLGIIICSTGIGVSIAANRFKGIRAALCRSKDDAIFARSHNNANVLCLGSKNYDFDNIKEIFFSFTEEGFASGRHLIRVNKIDDFD